MASKAEKVKINVHYKFLEAYRSTKIESKSPVNYAFSIYLGEAIIAFNGDTYLPFTIDVETRSEGIFFKVKGEVFIEGPREVVEQWVLSKGDEPPKIWSQLYSKVSAILSSLADYIHVPSPKAKVQ
jgi:hypothetical protein